MTSRVSVVRGPAQGAARLVAVLLVLAMSVALAACDAKVGEKASAKKPQSQPIEGGTTLAAIWPLTGSKVNGPTPDHPVLVTKIDNTASSQPQLGLKSADLVTEELVEGGMTRLAVFFYRHLPKVAGPVRSMRASDIGIVKPAHAVIVASGAAPPTLGRLRAAGVKFFEEGGPGYFREGTRRAPYNLMVDIPKLAATLKTKPVVPASYLPWGTEKDFTGVRPARQINAIFSKSHTTSWRYQGGKYHNDNSFAAEGERFVPDSLLVVRVRLGDAGYLDPAGNPVPETIYKGRGVFQLFHKGQVVRGTWSKKSKKTPIQLRTSAGAIKVPAGHVWVELVPTRKGGGAVTYTK